MIPGETYYYLARALNGEYSVYSFEYKDMRRNKTVVAMPGSVKCVFGRQLYFEIPEDFPQGQYTSSIFVSLEIALEVANEEIDLAIKEAKFKLAKLERIKSQLQ